MATRVYNKQYREWMNVEYVDLFDMDDNKVGTAEAEIGEWMDEIDVLSAKMEAVTVWASDNGMSVDELYFD